MDVQETWNTTGTLPVIAYKVLKEGDQWKLQNEELVIGANGQVSKQTLKKQWIEQPTFSTFADVLYWEIESLQGGSSLSTRMFSKSTDNNVTLNGWQVISGSTDINIEYMIGKPVNGKFREFGKGYVGQNKPKDEEWFTLTYSNVPNGDGYKVHIANIGTGIMKGAGNVYN
ncbi:hypothetical protein SAMN04487970_10812 [Paenibacillus tianmuensis]|uniref:Uncharacterized protein n=1 Tax=Paenibacillus tianmuensis TaxID=624147 RepID=A0A1G4TZ10_9BACL|nr:hypothetical protein [Paenibacillus tianmuensis]SCW86600.1 hypothetical protein SAMN04487970_10812 [Paenibacillus tianmuensis]